MNNTEQNGNLLRASNPNTSWMATNDIISSKNESSMGLNDDAEEMIWIKPNALLSKTTICNICNSLC
jgi:hypothetical protein